MSIKGFKLLVKNLVGCIAYGFVLSETLVAAELEYQDGSVFLMVDDPAYQDFLLKLEQEKLKISERNDGEAVEEGVLISAENTTVMRFSEPLNGSTSLNQSSVFIFNQAQENLKSVPADIQNRIDSIDALKKTIRKGL